MTTKIHAVVDGLGNPLRLLLSEGQESDIDNAPELLCTLTLKGTLESLGAIPNIPSRATNKVQRECDWWLYKERHLVECFWQKIKQFRRVATRYEKLAKTFLGFVYLASVLLLLK